MTYTRLHVYLLLKGTRPLRRLLHGHHTMTVHAHLTFNSTRLLRLLGHQTMTEDTHFAPYKACLGARLPLPIIMGKFSLLNYRGQHFENLQKIVLDIQIDIEGPSTWLYLEVCPNRLCVAGSRSQVIEGSPTRLLQQANIKMLLGF